MKKTLASQNTRTQEVGFTPPKGRETKIRRAAGCALLFLAFSGACSDGARLSRSQPEPSGAQPSGPVDQATTFTDEDGFDEAMWTGEEGKSTWDWSTSFSAPRHIGLIRASFGPEKRGASVPTHGVPTKFRWEYKRSCEDEKFSILERTEARSQAARGDALPTRRSWFVDVDACALRLVVRETNGGPPVLRDVEAFSSARNALESAQASDDGTYPGFHATAAVDGSYRTRWVGAPGQSQWTLVFRWNEPQPIRAIRLILGFDATSRPRGPGEWFGRTYGIAWGPHRYRLEGSTDGVSFEPIATEPTRENGSILPIRRRLIHLDGGRSLKAIRLAIRGATGRDGSLDPTSVPVVRELAAYRADDPHPVLVAPWILSVNANPGFSSHGAGSQGRGELANDVYHAKFLQSRFAPVFPQLREDDRFVREFGPRGELLDAWWTDAAGEALESIEGDDPTLDRSFLEEQSPVPIAILSGSNRWDFSATHGRDWGRRERYRWNPLRRAEAGGMGQLFDAVQARVAPFFGLCGGAQIIALLEAKKTDWTTPDEDVHIIDRVLRRTTGEPIRGFAPSSAFEFAWPGDNVPRVRVTFDPFDLLFADVAGTSRRAVTHALPESHVDAVRTDAFAPEGPLHRFELVATSAFCGPNVTDPPGRDEAFPDPNGRGLCTTVPQVFVSRDGAYPILGIQSHPEMRNFSVTADGDPPEAVSDPELLLAAAYEDAVDAYVRNAR